MNDAPTGAPAPTAPSRPLVTTLLRIGVHVDPACIEAGHNASGPTTLEVDAALLDMGERRMLRLLVEERTGLAGLSQVDAIPYPRSARPIRLPEPTLEALRAILSALVAEEATLKDLVDEDARLVAALESALADSLLATVPAVGTFVAAHESCGVAFSDRVVDAARDRLGPAFAEQVAVHRRACVEFVRGLVGDPARAFELPPCIRYPDDAEGWVAGNAAVIDPIPFLRRRPGERFGEHASWASAVLSVHRKAMEERRHAASPAGRIEAVLAELGTPSQVERWKAGFLPDAEVDAVLARRIFAPVLEVAEPETRLDREAVEREIRRTVPAVTVSKISFATEEAQGLSEREWEAFQRIRDAVPKGVAANVVRTLASVQTARDGTFSVSRPLVSLKGSFAGWDLRLRIDLGTGMAVAAA